jgi:DNA-binding transcriptional LysR family regulator
MIDRYLLRYFLAVIDHGNFSKAAVQCSVSQPTLSVGIAKLERLLAKSLFFRTNRRVELTEAGAHFAVHARRIESEFMLAERSVGDSPVRPTFRLGILVTIPSAWISVIAGRFAANFADERVELIEGRERDLLEQLGRARLDAALTIIRPEESRFASEILLTEGYSLALPAHHPLADQAVVSAEALADNVMIVRRQCEVLGETSRHFTRHGVRPFFAARTMNDDRALALVQAGIGVTVMPDGFSAVGIARPRLQGFDFLRSLGILHGAHIDDPLQSRAPCLTAMRSVVPELPGFSPKS